MFLIQFLAYIFRNVLYLILMEWILKCIIYVDAKIMKLSKDIIITNLND